MEESADPGPDALGDGPVSPPGHLIPPPVSRRRFVKTVVGTGVGGSVLAGLWTWRVEPVWLEITHRDLPIVDLPEGLEGRTLLHLTDLHAGPRVPDDYLIDSFRRGAELKPDYVVITGDFVTRQDRQPFDRFAAVLSHLPQGRLGTVGSLGNHDFGRNWSDVEVAAQVTDAATRAGVRVLRNEAVSIGGLRFAGFEDLWSGRFAIDWFRRLSSSEPTIALSHNPDTVDLPGWDGFRGWTLSGHTHGGQCKPPFLPPPLLPVKNRRYTSGEFGLGGGRRLYISRGVGYILRVRFNCRPEIALLRLIRAGA